MLPARYYQYHSTISNGNLDTVYAGYLNVEPTTTVNSSSDTAANIAIKRYSNCNTDTAKQDAALFEASLLMNLSHPHIIPVWDCFGDNNGDICMIMPLGIGSLHELLKFNHPGSIARTSSSSSSNSSTTSSTSSTDPPGGPTYTPLPTAIVIHIAYQLGQAIHYLHSQNIIHRDIQPEKILFFLPSTVTRLKTLMEQRKDTTRKEIVIADDNVSDDNGTRSSTTTSGSTVGRSNNGDPSWYVSKELGIINIPTVLNYDIVISDFSTVAQLQNTDEQLESFIGTRAYMAPEILAGDLYDKSIDIWSYGVLLFATVTGIVIGTHAKDRSMMMLKGKWNLDDIINRNKDILHLWQKVPESLSNLIIQCLKLNPHERIRSEHILQHPFFSGIREEKEKQRKLQESMQQLVQPWIDKLQQVETENTLMKERIQSMENTYEEKMIVMKQSLTQFLDRKIDNLEAKIEQIIDHYENELRILRNEITKPFTSNGTRTTIGSYSTTVSHDNILSNHNLPTIQWRRQNNNKIIVIVYQPMQLGLQLAESTPEDKHRHGCNTSVVNTGQFEESNVPLGAGIHEINHENVSHLSLEEVQKLIIAKRNECNRQNPLYITFITKTEETDTDNSTVTSVPKNNWNTTTTTRTALPFFSVHQRLDVSRTTGSSSSTKFSPSTTTVVQGQTKELTFGSFRAPGSNSRSAEKRKYPLENNPRTTDTTNDKDKDSRTLTGVVGPVETKPATTTSTTVLVPETESNRNRFGFGSNSSKLSIKPFTFGKRLAASSSSPTSTTTTTTTTTNDKNTVSSSVNPTTVESKSTGFNVRYDPTRTATTTPITVPTTTTTTTTTMTTIPSTVSPVSIPPPVPPVPPLVPPVPTVTSTPTGGIEGRRCYRCGRDSHYIADCYARRHIDGYYLSW